MTVRRLLLLPKTSSLENLSMQSLSFTLPHPPSLSPTPCILVQRPPQHSTSFAPRLSFPILSVHSPPSLSVCTLPLSPPFLSHEPPAARVHVKNDLGGKERWEQAGIYVTTPVLGSCFGQSPTLSSLMELQCLARNR